MRQSTRMYARAECLMEGTALVCGKSQQERENRNGARMGLIAMPSMLFIRAAQVERAAMGRVGRSVR